MMLNLLKTMQSKAQSMAQSKAQPTEKEYETKILQWMKANNKTYDSLLEDCGVLKTDELHTLGVDVIESIGGIETVVNIFCAPTLKFSPEYFKNQMEKLGMTPRLYHRLYRVLDTWKDQAEAAAICLTPQESLNSSRSSEVLIEYDSVDSLTVTL